LRGERGNRATILAADHKRRGEIIRKKGQTRGEREGKELLRSEVALHQRCASTQKGEKEDHPSKSKSLQKECYMFGLIGSASRGEEQVQDKTRKKKGLGDLKCDLDEKDARTG